jgi:hypothetical protein
VRKDDGGLALRLEDAVHLLKGSSHHLFVKAFRLAVIPAVPHRILHGFLRFGRKGRAKLRRVEMPDGALEPHVKKVRQIRVGHGVVVGRVGDDGVEEVVFKRDAGGGATKDATRKVR